ncbi:hypothetical protein Q8W71_14095 [Methylobacterium sp. NEAU 140]|uniref:hypothetical protein n=1 Tax=Methylobacterium sp. NEAU 140 TaxID=3064945 RepID=UPI002736CECC|nr:hypothetical protein [Methylobacterium sp. NEAU 140]MDP4023763.1 hypothetical protein [Methylobacterium sp. NEAU 140]
MDRAVQACAPRIEALAPNDFEWMRRPVGGIFQEAETPESPTSAVVRYQGDSIRFLSPQREWARIIYECRWDAAAGQVVAVNVRLGILGKPNAIVTSPAGGARPPAPPPPPPPAATAPPPKPVPAPEATLDKKRVGEVSSTELFQVKPKPGTTR